MKSTMPVLLTGILFALLTGCQSLMAPAIEKFAHYQTWVGHKSNLMEKVLGYPTVVEDILEGRYKTYKYIGAFQWTTERVYVGFQETLRYAAINECASEFLINGDGIVVDWFAIGPTSCKNNVPAAPGENPKDYKMYSKKILDLPVENKYVLPSAIKDLFTNRMIGGYYRNWPVGISFRRYYYEDGSFIELTKQYRERKGRWHISSEGICEQLQGDDVVCLRMKKDWLPGGARLIGFTKKDGMRSAYLDFTTIVDKVPVQWK